MKKFLTVALTALFVLGLAASAFAIHAEIPAETSAVVAKGETQVTIGGNLRTRYEWCENCNDANDDNPDHWTRWDQRARLSVEAKTSENTTGFIHLESSYAWGTGGSSAGGVYNEGNDLRDEPNILEAHITHNFGPASVKVGHMPLALGNKLFFDHTQKGDDALLVFADPTEQLHVFGLFIKLEEGGTFAKTGANNNHDVDAWVAAAVYKGEMFNASADITWVNDNSESVVVPFAPVAVDNSELDLYNIGVRGDAKVGPVNIKADAEFQLGAVKSPSVTLPAPVGTVQLEDADFEGTAFMVAADMDLDGTNVGVEAGRGSGKDPGGDDVELFITSLNGDGSRIEYQAFVYDTRIDGAAGVRGGGISNLTYAKGTVSTALSDALTGKAAIIWLKATEDTAIFCDPDVPGTECARDDELGIELDASMAYQLARNLKYWVEAGYLMVGDAYNSVDASNNLVEADDVYAVRTGLELAF